MTGRLRVYSLCHPLSCEILLSIFDMFCRLILQLLCKPIGNQNFRSKQNITSRLTGRHTVYLSQHPIIINVLFHQQRVWNQQQQLQFRRPSVNSSQLHQSRVGLLSQAVMMMITVGFMFSETLEQFWKTK